MCQSQWPTEILPDPSYSTPNIREYTYAAQHHFAVKAMAAQSNNFSGSIQSEEGAIYVGTNAGRDVHFNNIFSGISNKVRRIQYVA